MSHIYEAFVDIKECNGLSCLTSRMFTERYEVNAESRISAGQAALNQAEHKHPAAAEYDVRTTRILH
ncbi:MAG: hypothetical protein AAF215_21375 [Cyanobacteria bacterium P01_A01_bin.123]